MAHFMERHNPQHHMRARGNLSYLDFVRLLSRMWTEAHPDIPIVPAGAEDPAKYPAIYYGIQLRKTHPSEPKARYRETKEADGEAYVISGQRFQSIVNFTAITESDPVVANELIELFEDFMLEYTPVFKELGLSELVYSRRIPDAEENRPGAGVVRRTVSYMVTTEKVRTTKYNRLHDIVVNARTWLEDAIPSTHEWDQGSLYDKSPRYYLFGPNAYLEFFIEEDNLDIVKIPATNFRPNDLVYFLPKTEDSFPEGMDQGFYRIVAPVDDMAYSANMGYTIRKEDSDEEDPDFVAEGAGTGIVYYVPELGQLHIEDQGAPLTVNKLSSDNVPLNVADSAESILD